MNTFEQQVAYGMRTLDAPPARKVDLELLFVEAVHHWNRQEKFSFHDTSFSVATREGVAVYGPDEGVPPDLAYVTGDLWAVIVNSASSDSRTRVIRRSRAYLQSLREKEYSSYPRFWAPEGEGRLRIYPAASGTSALEFEGELDFPAPKPDYDAAASPEFSFPADQLAMSHAWFREDQGGPLIRNFALHLYAKKIDKDIEAASAYASAAEDARRSLAQRTEDIQIPSQTDPWPVF